MHLVCDREGLLPESSAGYLELRRLKLKARMATYCLFATNHQRQLADRQYNFDHDGGYVVVRQDGKGHA